VSDEPVEDDNDTRRKRLREKFKDFIHESQRDDAIDAETGDR
jgi:hypothetical protein